MSTRAEQKQATRERILAALVEVVNHDGVHAFSVQAVADRAGVSHRTVYRHFPTREALLDGLTEQLAALSTARGVPERPQRADEVLAHLPASYATFDAHADAARAYVMVSTVLGLEAPGRTARTESMRQALRERLPHLPEAELDGVFAVFRVLASTRSWLAFRELGVSGEQAGAWVADALSILIQAKEQP